MKTISFLLLCLIFQTSIYSQVVIKGVILDENSQPIEYASVGILNSSIGTITDQTGSFTIYFKKENFKISDSLRISNIGYYAQTLNLFALVEKPEVTIRLLPDVKQLNEVVVTSRKKKEKIIGSDGKSIVNMNVNFALANFENQNLGSEIGRKFRIAHKNTLLNEFSFFISKNNFEKVKFRINIYSVKKNKPGENLNLTNIIMDVTNKSTGWMTIDLSPYNIIVNEDIIVSTEWIYKNGKGTNLSLPIIMPTSHIHFYKYGSQNSWERYYTMTTLMELGVSY
jgi:hypothetical protein